MLDTFLSMVIFLFPFEIGSVGFILQKMYKDISPSAAACERALTTPLPASPCLAKDNNQNFTLPMNTKIDSTAVHSHINVVVPVLFFVGFMCNIFLCLWIWRWRVPPNLRKSKRRSFTKYVLERVQLVQTLLSIVSFVVWVLWSQIESDENAWMSTLNPSLSDEQFITGTRWFVCTRGRFSRIIMVDACVQGFTCCTIFIQLILVRVWSKSRSKDMTTLIFWDFLHHLCVTWALPIARNLPATRPYQMYHTSGVVRAVRVFFGFPMLSKTVREVSTTFRFAVEEEELHTYMDDLGEFGDPNAETGSDEKSLFRLALGQLVIWIQISAFLVASALLMTSLEGWPCEYQVPDQFSPCDCSTDLRTFGNSLYFVFITVTTVGYGDISPRTHVGRAAVVVVIVVGVYMLPQWVEKAAEHYKTFLRIRKTRKMQRDSTRRGTEVSTDSNPKQSASGSTHRSGRKGSTISDIDKVLLINALERLETSVKDSQDQGKTLSSLVVLARHLSLMKNQNVENLNSRENGDSLPGKITDGDFEVNNDQNYVIGTDVDNNSSGGVVNNLS